MLNKHRRSHVSVHGLDDLLDQNSLQYGVVKGSTLLHQMASSQNHDIQRVAEVRNIWSCDLSHNYRCTVYPHIFGIAITAASM